MDWVVWAMEINDFLCLYQNMIKAGIEVHGLIKHGHNVKKAEEQYEKGYISGFTTSLESLVQVVHNQDGIDWRSTRYLYDGSSQKQ